MRQSIRKASSVQHIPLGYWPPKAFSGSSNVLSALLSDFTSEAVWEDLLLGVGILVWLLEKISSRGEEKKKDAFNGN